MKLTQKQIIDQWEYWTGYLVTFNKDLSQEEIHSTNKMLKALSDQAFCYYGGDFEQSLRRPKYDKAKGYYWE